MSFSTLFTLFALAAPALATIAPTSPISSTSCKGGSKCNIKWTEDGEGPSIADFGETSVGLYVGNQLQQTMVQDFGNVDPTSSTTLSPTIDPQAGANSDAYFVRFQSLSAKDSNGQPLQSFSAKFTLSGMTGAFSDSIKAQMAGVTSGAAQGVVTATGGAAATVTATITKSGSSNAAAESGDADEEGAAAPLARVGLSALLVSALAFTLA